MNPSGTDRLDLLVFNLAMDADDPILGFATWWVRALATHCASVDVITMRAGRLDVPENVHVHSVGKERGYSEPRRAGRFLRVLRSLLARHRYGACFAHQMPLFAVMGWPLLRSRRIPITLWYAHRATPVILRVAERVVDRIVTSTEEAFRLPSPKVAVIGQGIRTDLFVPRPGARQASAFTITTVSRISPVKRLEVLVDAVAMLVEAAGPPDVRARIVGPVHDSGYERSLRRRVERAGLGEIFTFVGAVPPERLVSELHQADVVVNLSPVGLYDKAVLEAWSCGIPVVASNTAYAEPLSRIAPGLLVAEGDPRAVASALGRLRAMSSSERTGIGLRLREEVIEHHSLERLARLLCQDILVSRP